MSIRCFSNVKLAHKRSKGYLERIPIRSALHLLYSARRTEQTECSALSAEFPGVIETKKMQDFFFSQIFRAYLLDVSFVFLNVQCNFIGVEFGSGIQTFEHR